MEIFKRTLNTEQTKKDYKKVVWFYNLWSQLTESKAAKKVLEFADIQDGDKVIEIACGTGLVLNQILKKNPNGFSLGIDLSEDMLSKAHKLLNKNSLKNYELRLGDIFNLEIDADTFDKLINNFMIDLLPEDKFDQVLSEFYRILKPNGIAAISIFSFGKRRTNKIWVWLAKHFPKLLTNCRPVEIKSNLEKVGFEIEQELEISQNTFPSKVYKIRKYITL